MGEGPGAEERIRAAMERVWQRSFATLQERVEVLRRTAASLATGERDEAQRKAASWDAHKLAGALGTFGLSTASDRAREAEALLEQEGEIPPAEVARLDALVAQIQAEMDTRRPEAG